MLFNRLNFRSKKTPFVALATLVLSGCAAGTASQDPYGIWVGRLETTEGVCPNRHNSILEIHGKHLVFTPAEGAFVLQGTFRKKDNFYQAQLTEKGMRGQPFQMVFEARPEGENIVGVYASPRCRANISLRRSY